MTVYTYAQLEQLWINNGGPRSVAPLAAAIAEAESAGNSAATNPTDNNGTQTSWGLWQLSDGTHNQPQANILDPNVNAAAAVAKWKAAGDTFAADWGTYTSGAYEPFLSNSTPPDPSVPTGTTTSSSGGSGTGAGGATGTCVIGFPAIDLKVTSVGGGCIVSKSQARAVIGAMLMVSGVLVILPGIILMAAAAFGASGAGAAVGSAGSTLSRVPGYGHAYRAVVR
jgi:hypothetical protein